MVAIASRIAKLEARDGSTEMERWLNSLSEEQIDARISELTLKIRAGFMAIGVDCVGMDDAQVVELAKQHAEESQ